jgi:hypothetical protein
MNPLEVESILRDYFAVLEELDGVAVHTGTSADEIPQDASAVVVECGSAENILGTLYKATVTVALRSPALSVARATHDTIWSAVLAAAQDAASIDSAFEVPEPEEGEEPIVRGVEFAGLASPHGPISLRADDNTWLASIEMIVGVRAI